MYTKIDENLTTNVLILIYFIFFIPHVLVLSSVFSIVEGTIGKKTEDKTGGVSAVAQGLTHLG